MAEAIKSKEIIPKIIADLIAQGKLPTTTAIITKVRDNDLNADDLQTLALLLSNESRSKANYGIKRWLS